MGYWKNLQIHEITWTAGEPFAVRIFSEVTSILDKSNRRLTGDWFDITPEFASQVIRISTEKSGVPTFSHAELLDRIRDLRKKKIEAAVRRL